MFTFRQDPDVHLKLSKIMIRTTTCFLLALLTSAALHAQYGVLDPSFGTGGVVTNIYSTNIGNSSPADMEILPDGRLVTLGNFLGLGPSGLAFTRQLANGDLDPAFGNAGIALPDLDTTLVNGSWRELELYPDGRLLAGGTVGYGLGVWRSLPNGSPDASFGTGGLAHLPGTQDSTHWFGGIALQPDGKIVTVGYIGGIGGGPGVVTRFLPDGSLDPAFGTNGIVQMNDYPGTEFISDLALQPDGRILVTGHAFSLSDNVALVYRFNADGTPDPGFGNNGLVELSTGPQDDEGHLVRVLSSGKILVAGTYEDTGSEDHPMVARLNADGSVDTGFGVNGATQFAAVAASDIEDMHVQADGKLLICGAMWNGTLGEAMMMLRVNADGTPDPTFGTAGVVMTQVGNVAGFEMMWAAKVGPDAKIYAVGREGNLFTSQAVQVTLRYGSGLSASVQVNAPAMPSAAPNPATDRITLRFAEAGMHQLLVLDAQGRQVARHQARGQQVDVPLSDLVPGLYLLQDLARTWALRVVKE